MERSVSRFQNSGNPIKPMSKLSGLIQSRRTLLSSVQSHSSVTLSPIKNSLKSSNNFSIGRIQMSNSQTISKANFKHTLDSRNIKPTEKLTPIKRPTINSRIQDSSRFPIVNSLCGLPKTVVSIASKSATGKTSGKTKKHNQDAYFVHKFTQKGRNEVILGVMDGHGMFGAQASTFVKSSLESKIESLMLSEAGVSPAKNLVDLSSESEKSQQLSQKLIQIYRSTHEELTERHDIDVSFSGTTAICVIIRGNQCICSNCGDSRAIIGRFDYNNWTVVPLSNDHKPDLPSEKYRIESAGGRVETYKDPNGNNAGPARVWLKKDQIPGLAMSRSIGDLVAGRVGVIPEPEIVLHEFKKSDKFVIIASDGIWEFISSQECVDIVANYYFNGRLADACEELIRLATFRWNKEDDCVDDITIIIAAVNCYRS